jgi:glycerol kinase
VIEAMAIDSKVNLLSLKVDGGMVINDLLMQFQAAILNVPVVRPRITETTALGAAYAAGLATGFWKTTDELLANWQKDKEWLPDMAETIREKQYAKWKKAVSRTFNWVE